MSAEPAGLDNARVCFLNYVAMPDLSRLTQPPEVAVFCRGLVNKLILADQSCVTLQLRILQVSRLFVTACASS